MKKTLLCLLLLASPSFADEFNWIVNGDFAGASGWTGQMVLKDGREGGPAAYLENAQPAWKGYEQLVALPKPAPPVVEVSGWMRHEDVRPGAKDWQMARIAVVFFDAKGTQVGGWPADTARVKGTSDWEFHSNQYRVPSDAATLKLQLALDTCTGRAWFAGLECLVYDHDLKPLRQGSATHPSLRPPAAVEGPNWFLNPGFEVPGSLDWGQATLVRPGRKSLHAMKRHNDAPAWNLAGQAVDFQGKAPAFAVYSGWVRTKGVVPGKEKWEKARLNVDFRDPDNKQVGGWQASVCEVEGDTDWTFYEHRYTVPPGAAGLYADAGLGNCTGTAWFDDLALILLSSDGTTLQASLQVEKRTDTSDWYQYRPPAKDTDTAIDLSFLNHRPAGKHGFVKAVDGHFETADGKRIRFWGTNFVGPNLFLSRAQCDALAERLAKLGVNLLRFHFLDNDWGEMNLFDPKLDHTQAFLPESLDKMDYLVAALKKQGIYVYIDISVGRKFRAGDGVPAFAELEMGAKGVIHFSRRVIELNKKYAEALLTHVNPYTGLALKDDPVYVMSEIVNESSIFSGFGETNWPEPFWTELQGMYKAWGGKGSVTRFKFDWESQELAPTANPGNERKSLEFLLETVLKSNREMKAFLSKLSPHALLAGSNMGLPVLGDIRANAELDFIDTHAYWDHPQIWNVSGGWANVAVAPFNNTAQLGNPFKGSLLFGLSHAPVKDKPLFVSEWNDCFPNEWRLEGPPLMAAYGCLQDWDGLLQFDYGPEKPGTVRMTPFALNTRPDNEPLFQAGALIFRQGLMRPSDIVAVEPVSDGEIVTGGSRAKGLFDHPWLPYAVQVAKKFTGKEKAPDTGLGELAKLHDEAKSRVTSSTGEQVLDYKEGLLTLDSPQVKGFVGEVGGKVLRCKGLAVSFAKRNPWAATLAVSLDGKPLGESGRFLLVAQAKAENKGQVFNTTRTALKDPGNAPVLMQGVLAGLSMRAAEGNWRIVPLDASGNAGKPLKVEAKKGAILFTVSPKDGTATYLAERTEP